MEKLYGACRALYESAFGSEPRAWNDALFRFAFPDCLRVIAEGEKPVSMLFSIPYPMKPEKGMIPARYLYAVATDTDYRGRGLASRLIGEEIQKGVPLFLRPSSASLFSFYEKVGLSPLSPMLTTEGAAEKGDFEGFERLDVDAYLTVRESFLKPPFALPTREFLSLGFLLGGAICRAGEFVAFYERHGHAVYFKEWLGNRDFAPRAAAFLGAETYRLRTPDPMGEPFGVGVNVPRELAFSIALD